MSINDELAAIEAVMGELEQKIKDGKISVEKTVEYLENMIRRMPDPQMIAANAQEVNAKIMGFIGVNKIDVLRLRELKQQYPNDPHINMLGRRAAVCYVKLFEIGLVASEVIMDVTSNVRLEIQSLNKETVNKCENMMASMFFDGDDFVR